MPNRVGTASWDEKRQLWRIDVTNEQGKRKSFTSAKPGRTGQRIANAKADEWLASGVAVPSSRVEELYVQWIQDVMLTTDKSNYLPIQSRWKNHVQSLIGRKKVSSLTEYDLKNIVDVAYSKGLSKKTLTSLCYDLKSFCKWMRLKRISTLHPEDLKPPAGARNSVKMILQPSDVLKLFNIDTTLLRGRTVADEYVNAYRFQVVTGLRPGEIIGLRWCDIHESRCDVRRSINIYKEETHGKNENAVRSFALTDTAKAVLNAQRELTGDFESVFCIKSESTYRHRWALYCSSNGINPCTPYELRHTFVSMMKRLPEGELKQLVGHSKDMDTFGIYGHAFGSDAEDTAQAVNGVLFKILNPESRK